MPPSPLQSRFARDGAALCPAITDPQTLSALAQALDLSTNITRKSGVAYAARNILTTVPQALAWATSQKIQSLLQSLTGTPAFPVRAILFDKLPGANWPVGWHQDVVIPVQARVDAPGYGPWSTKASVVHVRPPVAVLKSMIALRLHLDDCPPENGALKIIPGSHHEMLTDDQISEAIQTGPIQTIPANPGDILAMRPLILHASAPATIPARRRVLHIEFTTQALPHGPKWPQFTISSS